MRRLSIIASFLFIILFSGLQAQEVRSRTSTESGAIETYSVLRKDKKLKHGGYEKKTQWGQLVSKGEYDRGTRVGIWDFYDYRTGLLEQKFDYEKNEFIYLTTENSKLNHIKYKGEWILDKLDSVPVVIGGLSNLRLLLMQTAFGKSIPNYFPKAGVAIFTFVISSEGITTEFEISQSSGNEFEKFVLREIQEYAEFWIPGVYKAEKVDTKFILPMNVIYHENKLNSKRCSIDFNYPEMVINTIIDNREKVK